MATVTCSECGYQRLNDEEKRTIILLTHERYVAEHISNPQLAYFQILNQQDIVQTTSAGGIGIVFGYYPARSTVSLNPI